MELQLCWGELVVTMSLRTAPEQVHATSEEVTLLQTPDAELLGIKDLIEGGAFKSQQYLGLQVPSQNVVMMR